MHIYKIVNTKNRVRSISTGRKISKAKKGHVVSAETRDKISKANKGKHLTDAQRKKHAVAVAGTRNGFFGKTHSESVKQKLRDYNSKENHPQFGKSRSMSTKLKIGESRRKYPICSLISPTGQVFTDISNVREFAKIHGLDSSAISRLFSGKSKIHKGWTVV